MKKAKKEAQPEAQPKTKLEAKPEEAKAEKKAEGESPALTKYMAVARKRRPTLPGALVQKMKESKTKAAAQRVLCQYLRDNNVT